MSDFTGDLISRDRLMEKMRKKMMSAYDQKITKWRTGHIKESFFLGIIGEVWKDACVTVENEPAVKLERETQDKNYIERITNHDGSL